MRKTKLLIAFLLSIPIIILIIIFSIKQSVNPLIYKNLNEVPKKYTAIIYGAGIIRGKPSKYLRDRLDAGVALYKAGKVRKILVSGDNGSKSYDELTVMKNYCAAAGIPKEHIFVDYAGFDTYSTVFRAKQIFKVEEAIMVSQNYHLDRAVYLGKKMGMDAIGFAADKGSYHHLHKNKLREYAALFKSFVDVHLRRQPKFAGRNEEINIKGNSN